LVRSDDEGENWIEVSHFQSDNPTGGSESALIVLKNGTFHAIIRSCYDDYESYDEGLTWVAVDPAIPYFLAGDGDNRWPTASWLDDENIFYTEENGSQPPGYGKYMLSNDNLSSVSNITTIYSYHIGGNSDGYPDHCILPLRSYNATHNYGGWAYVVYCDESNAFLRGIFVYNNQTYPKTFPESNIVINSINDLENNSVTTIGYRYFNWTRVDAATKYQLQISNDSLFTDVFVDLDDIYEGCPYEAMLGGSYEETGGYVEFYLPYAYNISWFGDHYYRVRAYSTDP